MELEVYNAANDLTAIGGESQVGFDEQLQELIRRGSLDFDTWTSIILEIEKTYPDNIEKICSVYDSFLSEYPLCHGYWRKYAAHKSHLCTVDKVVNIFERAVQSATYCVGVWVEYCSFGMSAYEDPSDVRRLFKRAMSFVGKDYLCHPLWDKYVEFEFSQQQWSFLAQIYVQTLKFPTKKLHRYYDNFKKFAAILEEEMKQDNNCSIEIESESVPYDAVTTLRDEVSCVINNLLDPSTGSFSYKALQKYISIGERFYEEACELERKIHCFETNIRRTYFHVMPLDDNQLENWHRYLDFVEMQEDFDWGVKLYERCLIPCAGYPEFWMRYVEFMETKGGREIANLALDRATKIFLKNVPSIHLFNARIREQIGDRYGARAAFLWSDNEYSSYFIEKVVKEANMEKRSGNFVAASSVYEKALEIAVERQKLRSVPILYIHFSHLKYMMTGSVDAARDVIINGIQHVPHCKLLLEGLIKFLMMHGGVGQVNVVDTIVADAISPRSDTSQGLGTKDREDISLLYLQFVDQCGTVHDIRKAWNRHIKLFPHLIRSNSLDKLPTSGSKKLLEMLMEGRQKKPFPMSDMPSRGQNSDHLTQLQMQEQSQPLPEHHAIHSDQVFADQFQAEDNDNNATERLQQFSPKVAEQSVEDASIVNQSSHDSVHQSGDDASGQMESTPYLVLQSGENANRPVDSTHGLVHQSGEDAYGQIESTNGSVHQSGEDAYGPMESTPGLVLQQGEDATGLIEPTHGVVHQVADDDAFLEASREYSDSINDQQEQDHEPEPHLKLLSLDGLSLNSQEKEYGDSMPLSSYEHQGSTSNRMPENCQNANGSPSIVSPGSTRSADSAQIQNKSVHRSPLVSHQSPLPEQAHPKPQVPKDGAGNWHRINNAVQASGDARSRYYEDSLDHENQQGKVSPQQQYQPAHPLSAQNPQVQQGIQAQNQDQVSAAQGNTTATHSWPTQNLQQQSFVSVNQLQPSSLPASRLQAHMPQFSMQSGGQFGHTPYNQAYNQMMENYLQQQQQMIVQQHYEQQQQFMQQLQQEVQQPYQQQQHLLQPLQQHELYIQQQQQLAQLYYQQLPLLQEEQAQLMRQQLVNAHQQQDQLYHQFMQLQEQQQAYQQLQQQNPMQQQQGYQQLQQQHQLQQQQGYQQVLEHLHQQHQQQQEEEQRQHQRQIPSTQNLTRNRSYYQQGQQVMPPHGASASGTAESAQPQQQSHVITPPHHAAVSRSAISPNHQQQPPHGVSPPHSAGASGPATSLYNQQ